MKYPALGMSRREFLTKAGVGSLALASLPALGNTLATPASVVGQRRSASSPIAMHSRLREWRTECSWMGRGWSPRCKSWLPGVSCTLTTRLHCLLRSRSWVLERGRRRGFWPSSWSGRMDRSLPARSKWRFTSFGISHRPLWSQQRLGWSATSHRQVSSRVRRKGSHSPFRARHLDRSNRQRRRVGLPSSPRASSKGIESYRDRRHPHRWRQGSGTLGRVWPVGPDTATRRDPAAGAGRINQELVSCTRARLANTHVPSRNRTLAKATAAQSQCQRLEPVCGVAHDTDTCCTSRRSSGAADGHS